MDKAFLVLLARKKNTFLALLSRLPRSGEVYLRPGTRWR